jgi:hypothetical protein
MANVANAMENAHCVVVRLQPNSVSSGRTKTLNA